MGQHVKNGFMFKISQDFTAQIKKIHCIIFQIGNFAKISHNLAFQQGGVDLYN